MKGGKKKIVCTRFIVFVDVCMGKKKEKKIVLPKSLYYRCDSAGINSRGLNRTKLRRCKELEKVVRDFG